MATDKLTNITPDQFATIDYSQLGVNSGSRQQRSFLIENNAASTDPSIPVRVGSLLGCGGQFNDTKTKVIDANAAYFKKSVSAIDYDTTSLVKSDSVIGVGTVQAFSLYTCSVPVYIYKMTVTSQDSTQLASDVTYNYIKPDLNTIQANLYTAAQTYSNRPPSGAGDVNIWLAQDLGELVLSPVNYLEFTSYDGKSFTLTFDIAAVALIGQFKIL